MPTVDLLLKLFLKVVDSPATSAIALVAGAIAYFLRLGGFPLDARFTIIGVAALIVYAALLRWIWKSMARVRVSVALLFGSLILTLALCMAEVEVLHLTCFYHNVTYFRNTANGDPYAGQLTFLPSRFPSNLSVDVSVQQERARLEQLIPKDCGKHLVRLDIENQGPYQVRYVLSNFVFPQCFLLAYRLSGPENLLMVDPVIDPPTVALVRPEEFRSYHRLIYGAGGGVWLLGAILLSYRWCSLRRKQ
jgi:hypothetical protein